MSLTRIPRVLSIAGSDSGGGAGIQADLKALAACGVHGMTALTAITAQNTVAVTQVMTVPPEMIRAQVEAVASDIGLDAIKIGMLGNASTVQAVRDALSSLSPRPPIVLDPVMVAESGANLLEPAARVALVELLVPMATVITPNLPEALVLTDRDAWSEPSEPDQLVSDLLALGPGAVVVTGGHRQAGSDLFYDGRELVEIPGERFPDGAAHGSGCTHSSVLAARLAWGDTPLRAAREAKRLASQAVSDGLRELGAGAGPVDVMALRANPALT